MSVHRCRLRAKAVRDSAGSDRMVQTVRQQEHRPFQPSATPAVTGRHGAFGDFNPSICAQRQHPAVVVERRPYSAMELRHFWRRASWAAFIPGVGIFWKSTPPGSAGHRNKIHIDRHLLGISPQNH